MHWLAICGPSDMPERRRPLPDGPGPALLTKGTLVVELSLPAPPPRAIDLLRFERDAGWARRLQIVLEPDGVLRLIQRQGPGRAEVAICLRLPREMAGLRLSYVWNAPRRVSWLTAEVLDGGQVFTGRGHAPLPLPAEDVEALFAQEAEGLRHASVRWMGLSSDDIPPMLDAAVSAGTPIRTPGGQMRADRLRPGDLVTTRDRGAMPLRHVRRLVLPTHGSFTPVRLRAPFYTRQHDLIVAPGQRLALSGAEVEYLLGDEEVLIAARQLVNNRSALAETRRPFISYVSLVLDSPEVIWAGDCPIGSSARAGSARQASWRDLKTYEAVTLQEMLEQRHSLRVA